MAASSQRLLCGEALPLKAAARRGVWPCVRAPDVLMFRVPLSQQEQPGSEDGCRPPPPCLPCRDLWPGHVKCSLWKPQGRLAWQRESVLP